VILGPSVMGQVEVRADDGDGGAPGPPLLSVPRGPGGGPDAIFFYKKSLHGSHRQSAVGPMISCSGNKYLLPPFCRRTKKIFKNELDLLRQFKNGWAVFFQWEPKSPSSS
jgi:hypothetical protein